MIIDWLVITITVITVLFLRGQIPFLLYITIYISISYVLLRGVYVPQILIGTIGTGTLWPFLPSPYQALQSPQQFIGHVAGIACDAEIGIDLHRLEVRVIGTVIPTSDSN